MNCATISHIDPDGTKHYKPKKVYDTLDKAINEAKRLNSLDKQLTKLVAYKCDHCYKYHIGRNGKTLSDKEKLKFRKSSQDNISLRPLYKIEL